MDTHSSPWLRERRSHCSSQAFGTTSKRVEKQLWCATFYRRSQKFAEVYCRSRDGHSAFATIRSRDGPLRLGQFEGCDPPTESSQDKRILACSGLFDWELSAANHRAGPVVGLWYLALCSRARHLAPGL